MASLNGHFDILKSRIEPDADRASKASEIAGKVRDHLKTHEEFITEDPHTRLTGSYARKTAIKNIKDVDIVVFVDQARKEGSISDLMNDLHSALSDLPETLGEGTVCELTRQRRSVNVDLPDSNMSLDIVPVLKTSSSHLDVLEIPDREWDDWVYTHPLGYGDLLSKINGNNNRHVIPHIKLMKHWRDMHFVYMKPKSYWLESAVVQHISRGWVETSGKGDDEIFADLLDSFYNKFKPVQDADTEGTPFIPDARWRNPVAWNWKRSHFNRFMTLLDTSRKKAREAVDIKASDFEKAVALWQDVFGKEWFPTTEEVDEKNKKTQAAVQSNEKLFLSTGLTGGSILTKKPDDVKTIAVPPNRYFGADKR